MRIRFLKFKYILSAYSYICKIVILTLCFIVFNAFAVSNTENITLVNKKQKELVVYCVLSDELNDTVYSPQLKGFLEVVNNIGKSGIKLKVYMYYMNSTTKNKEYASLRSLSIHILDKINKINPDYVVTFGDVAFNYVGIEASKKYKVLFSGISEATVNSSSFKNISNLNNVIGVSQVVSLNKLPVVLKDFKRHIIIRDTTESSEITANEFKKAIQDAHVTDNVEVIKIDDVQHLKLIINQLNDIASPAVLYLAVKSVKDLDTGKYLSTAKILEFLANTNTFNLEVSPSLVSLKYITISVSPDYVVLGKVAGTILLNNFFSRKTSIDFQKSITGVNITRLNELRFSDIYLKHYYIFDVVKIN